MGSTHINNTSIKTQDNVFDAVIMTKSLPEFIHSSDGCRTVLRADCTIRAMKHHNTLTNLNGGVHEARVTKVAKATQTRSGRTSIAVVIRCVAVSRRIVQPTTLQ